MLQGAQRRVVDAGERVAAAGFGGHGRGEGRIDGKGRPASRLSLEGSAREEWRGNGTRARQFEFFTRERSFRLQSEYTYCCSTAAAVKLHVDAGLSYFVWIAGVVLDVYGRHGTRWEQCAKSASDGSCGELIILVHH